MTPPDLARTGLTPQEYDWICEKLKRPPNRLELGMFGVMWSEHCCYKNSKPFLRQFPTQGAQVVVGPGENAGVIDLGGVYLAFKVESHNHPSAVEPFQGAATGVGGILRDIFTLGARPIALLNSLRFGDLELPRNRALLTGVVAGISHYGNCVGVPTVGGEVYFDPVYNGNPLVNVMALGILPTAQVMPSGAQGVGNPVVYVGATTGRDGMGGASFASAELADDTQAQRPAVQVGDPFLEKCLIEACLEAFATGAVVACQDMGAAGLTCATSEMGAKGGVGIRLDLDKIPVRETGMQPLEFMLSESQERMLMVVAQGREREILPIFHRWGLEAVVAGAVIAESEVQIIYKNHMVARIPALALTEDTPIYEREVLPEPPPAVQNHWAWSVESLPPATSAGILGHTWHEIVLTLLDQPNLGSKRWLYQQYDQQVQNNTAILPGVAAAAVVRVQGHLGVAATMDGNGRWVSLDPERGAMAMVAEAARNLSCVGAEPLAVTDNLNFGSPEKPEIYWQLALACRGLAHACRELGTPVTGGNVSLYNETQGQAIYPTPVVGMVGRVRDIRHRCTLEWQAGQCLYLLGIPWGQRSPTVGLGGSEYLAVIHNLVTGRPPAVDLAREQRVQTACRTGIHRGWVQAAQDVSDGGIFIALAEMAIASKCGVQITANIPLEIRWDEWLFGEGGSRIWVTVAPELQTAWEAYLQEHLPGEWGFWGITGGASLVVQVQGENPIDLPVTALQSAWAEGLSRRLEVQNAWVS
ncbi:phosphoribosylformylglycinamidine synthase II [Gloeomargarita lithophora Alchichica-D10]|uniref:Phosphoribosylformylglycinamidine synthase subunit PurL n=1 Tax=Gloeomargarita lithophora Alchichica-D10 TaxID=1188229 RepID=A0A1J0ACX9_9CYAN|nr:phosphoribosylformylglycinamidine synthase subunit PurL [Gloeomargarita lithophora]APB33798.1 phosphoribosylformylglycinamidine synthase II [Gloeomargarita lithophora Alchichica-D10]